jgi:hypothetical protein
MPIMVATSTAEPSTFHAIDLSLVGRVPKIDQVVPPSLETKNGAWSAPKVPANICEELIELTAMLGSEFCAVSALSLAGIRSTARRRNGKLDVAVMDHSLSATPTA